jgi:hypothetical protein
VSVRRFWILGSGLLLALALGACGHKVAHPHDADSNNNGFYIDAGPVTYQLQVSRELNPYNIEDQAYLRGLPTGTAPPAPNEEWYGVFLWAKNQTGQPAVTANNFDIIDTQGTTYHPVSLDPGVNPFAWTAQTLKPLETQPLPSSVASNGPTQGSELLFKINTSAYSNRPLTLEIRGPSNQLLGTISLDL